MKTATFSEENVAVFLGVKQLNDRVLRLPGV